MSYLVTFKNKLLGGNRNVLITDPYLYMLSGGTDGVQITEMLSTADYITIEVNEINQQYRATFEQFLRVPAQNMITKIETFLNQHPDFLENKQNYYTEFSIPKRKLGPNGEKKYRHLINPMPELKRLQRDIADFLLACNILPHNAAHAFREKRDYKTNSEVHKNSSHIINLDMKDFFNHITEEVLNTQLRVHPFFSVDKCLGDKLLDLIIKVATYKGCTPQGSPLSPMLSNLIMVQFDFRIRKKLNDNQIKMLYTRYADDLTFSSKKSEDITNVIHMVEYVLKEYYNDTIKINYSKTKKITPGRCFITGVKLNQKHQLTVGWEKKKLIKSRIHNLAKKIVPNGNNRSLVEEAQSVLGYLAFMNRIEPGYVAYIYSKYDNDIRKISNII